MVKSAMVLAAGLGVRMRPLTDTLPKPLIPVAGKSMLERTFDHLKYCGIERIVVNTHYLADQIKEKVRAFHPHVLLSHEEVLLETGGGIKKALPLLGDDPFFVLNGDSVWGESQSLKDMEALWDRDKMDALLLLVPRVNAHGYEGKGDFVMTEKGELSRLGNGSGTPYVYIGVQLISPSLFEAGLDGRFSMNLLWDEALQNKRLYGYVHQGEWFHISTPEDLQKYEPQIAKLE